MEVVEVPQDGVQRHQVQGDGQCAAGDGISKSESKTWGEVDDEVWRELEACSIPEVPLQVLEKHPPEVEVNAEDVAKQNFKNKLAELQEVNTKPITFATPVSDRRDATVINAVSMLYSKFRALQIPLYRLRVDPAKELCSQRLRA